MCMDYSHTIQSKRETGSTIYSVHYDILQSLPLAYFIIRTLKARIVDLRRHSSGRTGVCVRISSERAAPPVMRCLRNTQ